jgi:hypothetical protein
VNDPTPQELERDLAAAELAGWQRAELAVRLRIVENRLADVASWLPGVLAEVREIRHDLTQGNG